MTVRINKSAFNIREKLSELERPIGVKGNELMRAETAQDARDFISAGRKNILINGDMQVSQRGTATGITGDNYGGPDRYKCFISGAGTWTLSQQADAPSGTGLYYSYKFQCTSTGTLSSGSYIGHRTILEGYDSARLNGQQFTISFWVKCNKTGTMTCEPFDASSGATQSVSKQFTINAADTWEYKTITFPANPHNYPANNAGALVLHWWLSAGSTWNSTASTGQWTNFANGFRAYGCNIDLLDSTSNYFQITGIQLEVGRNATEFEHRSYGEELALCQRYYQKHLNPTLRGVAGSSTALNRMGTSLPVTMRDNPVISVEGTFSWYDGNITGTFTSANIASSYSRTSFIEIEAAAATGTTATYRPIVTYITGTASYLICSSEL